MRIIPLEAIRSVITPTAAIEAVKKGFIAMAKGQVTLPEPMQILFHDNNGQLSGDCHAKAAQAQGIPYFVIKVASGFYNNPARGLAVNNGLVLVMSAETGSPIAILQDDGWLTQMRTAAAGALAAGLKPVSGQETLGIIGTGTQACLQAQMICHHLRLSKVAVYGRSPDKSAALTQQLKAEGINATVATSVKTLCQQSTIVVTTTPATEPVITADDIPEQLHIIAVGADSPGKLEIDPAIMARADVIITDNHTQCLHHGDFGAAARAGVISADSDVNLCELLATPDKQTLLAGTGISVVDLTGLGIQDLAMATLALDMLDKT